MREDVPESDGFSQPLGEFVVNDSLSLDRCNDVHSPFRNRPSFLFAQLPSDVDHRLGTFLELPFDRVSAVLLVGSCIRITRQFLEVPQAGNVPLDVLDGVSDAVCPVVGEVIERHRTGLAAYERRSVTSNPPGAD